MTVRALLVDDDAMMRECLRTLLEQGSDIQIVGEANDGRMVLELVRELAPDVVVIDVSMPGMNGVEATRLITAEHGHVKVIALSNYSDKRYVQHMLGAGARGYVLKPAAHAELVRAVRDVERGQIYISAEITGTFGPDERGAAAEVADMRLGREHGAPPELQGLAVEGSTSPDAHR